jgi:predicted transglutaminase-like cysteine proteinase
MDMTKIYLLCILLLTGCTSSLYVSDITPNKLPLKNWEAVIARQLIVEGKGKPSYSKLQEINEQCNAKPYAFNGKSNWITPMEFNKAKTSDCTGVAICKYYALRQAGWKTKDINVWVGGYKEFFFSEPENHMIITVKFNGKDYALDNPHADEPTIIDAAQYFSRFFQPIYRFNERGWKRSNLGRYA